MTRKFTCEECGYELAYHTDMTTYLKSVCPKCGGELKETRGSSKE